MATKSKKDYQRRADGTYFRQLRHPITHKRVTVVGSTIGELERRCEHVKSVRADMRLGATLQEVERRISPVLGCRMTVDECFKRYQAGLVKSHDKCESIWTTRLAPWFHGKNLWELSADVMAAWEGENRRAGYALATVKLAYDVLAAAVNLQVPTVIPGLPWGKWRPERESKDERYVPKRPALFSIENLQLLLAQATLDDVKQWKQGRYSVHSRITCFAALCGLRQAELAGLGWDHVEIDDKNEDNHTIFVEYQGSRAWKKTWADRPRMSPKDGPRHFILHPTASAILRLHREELRRRGWYRIDGPVWPRPGGGWFEGGKAIKPAKLKKWAKAAEFPQWEKWCAHSLRHTMVCLELRGNGGDIISTMKRSGHASVDAIRGYMHAMGSHIPRSSIGLTGGEECKLLPAMTAEGYEIVPAPVLDRKKTEELVELEAEALRDARFEREDAKKQKRDRSYDTLDEIFRRWDEAGRPGEKPEEITARARRAYLKGYGQAKRAGLTPPECQAAGRRARGQLLGGWGAAVKRIKKMAALPAVTATAELAAAIEAEAAE